jgi:hypothetical protein
MYQFKEFFKNLPSVFESVVSYEGRLVKCLKYNLILDKDIVAVLNSRCGTKGFSP